MQNRVLNINSIYLKTKLLESLNDLLFCISGLFAWFCLIRWIISNINKLNAPTLFSDHNTLVTFWALFKDNLLCHWFHQPGEDPLFSPGCSVNCPTVTLVLLTCAASAQVYCIQLRSNYKTHERFYKQAESNTVCFFPSSIKVGLITCLLQALSVKSHYTREVNTDKYTPLKHQTHNTALLLNTHRATVAFHRGGKGKILKKLYLCF